MSTTSNWKDIGIRKQSLWRKLHTNLLAETIKQLNNGIV